MAHSGSAAGDDLARLPARIAVGVDGYPEGADAAALAAMIARATGAELLLVAVHPDPLIVLPAAVGWSAMRNDAERLLRETRDSIAPGARMVVETDWSVPRALERVVDRDHCDLLIVGSSRAGARGRVRIGTRARQLLSECTASLAVAPRGLREGSTRRLERIGLGYDGGPQSKAALTVAASIAIAARARLSVRAVVDDRLPTFGWFESSRQRVFAMWESVIEPEVESLADDARRAVAATHADAEVEVLRGGPADALRELCEHVDLLVLGSRRWGVLARVLLGSTGEALMHDASCPVLVVPSTAG
jgi:nucleotide-binding universal stress UspA family protein